MSWILVLQPEEMELFRHCRRAWDFSARTRQNYVPSMPTHVFDFDKAIHEALGVYYFPAMDDWDRAIVRPLAVQGFHRSMRHDRQTYETFTRLTAEQEREWREHLELGETVLGHYFAWAAAVDEFDSLFSAEDVWAPIPDPHNPGNDLRTPDGQAIRYFGRLDQLISDPNDEHWVVDHRIAWNDWQNTDELLLDVVSLSYVWALELSYPQLRVAGTIYNELRIDAQEGGGQTNNQHAFDLEERDKRNMARGARRVNLRRSAATPSESELIKSPQGDHVSSDQRAADPTEVVKQEGNERFRRTRIRRSRASIENIGVQIAMQALEMRGPNISIYPNPSEKNCPSCAYRRPCIAINDGVDPAPILATHYRKRREEEFEQARRRWPSVRGGMPASLGGVMSRARHDMP
jgi:hypothetical protein